MAARKPFITINIIIDLKELMNINRYTEKNRTVLLDTAANRYLKYLKTRFISFSAGRGDWDPLKPDTIRIKTKRGVRGNPSWILRESDTLLNSLGIKKETGRIRVGLTRYRAHPRFNGTSIMLRKIHQYGDGVVPQRIIVPVIASNTRRQIVDDIKKEYNKIIRANRRKGK